MNQNQKLPAIYQLHQVCYQNEIPKEIIIKNFSKNEIHYMSSKYAEKISTIEKSKLNDFFVVLITGIFQDAGQKIHQEDASYLIKRLQEKYSQSNLSVNDLKIAFAEGVCGNYGEYYGINVVSISKWISAYQKKQSQLFNRLSELRNSNFEKTEVEEIEYKLFNEINFLRSNPKNKSISIFSRIFYFSKIYDLKKVESFKKQENTKELWYNFAYEKIKQLTQLPDSILFEEINEIANAYITKMSERSEILQKNPDFKNSVLKKIKSITFSIPREIKIDKYEIRLQNYKKQFELKLKNSENKEETINNEFIFLHDIKKHLQKRSDLKYFEKCLEYLKEISL